MILLKRLAGGVANHFDARFMEWAMGFAAFGMGAVLRIQPDVFSTSPSFAVLARWGDESWWAVWVLVAAVIRLVALAVNGTFNRFPYSPHLRAVASLVGILFWSRFSLGVLSAAIDESGAWTGVIAYTVFTVIELRNLTLSIRDMHLTKGV